MARSEQQIMKELDAFFQPTKQLVERKKKAAGIRAQADRKRLQNVKTSEFANIRRTARNRGLADSGFRTQQEERFISDRLLPLMDDIAAREQDTISSLADILAGAYREQGSLAANIRQKELDREFAAREAAASRAAAARSSNYEGIINQLRNQIAGLQANDPTNDPRYQEFLRQFGAGGGNTYNRLGQTGRTLANVFSNAVGARR